LIGEDLHTIQKEGTVVSNSSRKAIKVLYNASHIAWRAAEPVYQNGLYRYVTELFKALAGLGVGVELVCGLWDTDVLECQTNQRKLRSALPELCQNVFTSHSSRLHLAWFYEAVDRLAAKGSAPRAVSGVLKRLRFLAKSIARFEQAEQHPWQVADVFHTPAISSLPLNPVRGLPHVVTVHDVIPVQYPHFSTKHRTQGAVEQLNRIRFDTDVIICDSESACQDALSLLPISPERCFVVPLAAAPHFCPVQERSVLEKTLANWGLEPHQYILTVAVFEPRKNIELVVKCFEELTQNGELDKYKLVLTGGSPPWCSSVTEHVRKLISKSFPGQIVTTGRVSDEELRVLYSGARVFVHASHCEGFGLAPLEAMQCGAAVICSNRTSLPEVVGDAAIQVSPDDPFALREAIKKVILDEGLWQDLRYQSITQAKRFSWERTAQLTAEVYRYAVENYVSWRSTRR